MAKGVNESNHEKDDSRHEDFELHLRTAHQQIQVRPEWAEEVLNRIAIETKRTTEVEFTAKATFGWPGTWQMAATLAAGILLAILGGTWIAITPGRNSHTKGNNEKSQAIPSAHLDAQPIASESPKSSESIPQGSSTSSLRAAPGYLAARVSADDPDFEIYVVLPQRNHH